MTSSLNQFKFWNKKSLTITSQDGASGLQFTADPTVGADAFSTATATPSDGNTASPTS